MQGKRKRNNYGWNGPCHSPWNQSGGRMGSLWWGGFVKHVGFKPRVNEYRELWMMRVENQHKKVMWQAWEEESHNARHWDEVDQVRQAAGFRDKVKHNEMNDQRWNPHVEYKNRIYWLFYIKCSQFTVYQLFLDEFLTCKPTTFRSVVYWLQDDVRQINLATCQF